jgi:hypothetical protein
VAVSPGRLDPETDCGGEGKQQKVSDRPILSSERMLHKGYYRKGKVEKKILVVSLKELGAKKN